ncbi:MAG: hypothetical protein CM15mP31_4820 [Gammaproteobacteria bacterium]|nr:MAG: hypothetical protein CM15mP31_4820 [Gammaproteobacteria bacterium]
MIFLNNICFKGAAVLKVNYRGSGGYGTNFMEMYKNGVEGFLMILQMQLKAVQKELGIGREQTCAFGASYGGYAALAMAYKYSELYECVAGGWVFMICRSSGWYR